MPWMPMENERSGTNEAETFLKFESIRQEIVPGEEPPSYFLMDNQSQGAVSDNTISAEEQQIRNELEADVEEDLEQEIVDNMCRNARSLQRLYQHKHTRELTSLVTNYQFPLSHAANAVLPQMNIRIQLDRLCRIDISKVGQPAAIQLKLCCNTDQFEKRQGSTKTGLSNTVYHRKQQNHPVVPWR